jgi:dolichyl-phosphate-mannose-protein mannosyltransferase
MRLNTDPDILFLNIWREKMNENKPFKKAFLIMIILFFLLDMSLFASENLFLNSGFEEDTNTHIFWENYDWNKSINATRFTLDSENVFSGNKSLLIDSSKENDARVMQIINTEPDSLYKISCMVKTKDIPNGKTGANISVINLFVKSNELHGTNDEWTELVLYGSTGNNQNSVQITFGIGGYGSLNTGKTWFDELKMEKLESAPPGVRVQLLYNPDTQENGKKSKNEGSKSSYLPIILLAFLIIIFFIFLLISSKNSKKGKSNKNEIIKTNKLDDKSEKFNKRDRITVIIMTFVYLVIALINLGDMKGPDKYWKPSAAGESVIVDFGNELNITALSYNLGIGKGELLIEGFKENGFEEIMRIKPDNYQDVFLWKIARTGIRTDKIKITVIIPGFYINELGFLDADNKFIDGFTLKDIKNNTGTSPENMFDEQDTLIMKPSYLNSTYFDEIYHARTAYEYLQGIYPYENTHPPLGKIIISFGIMIFGMNPFGWRIAGTLFGVFMIPLMYKFGKKVFKRSEFAFIAAFLMMFDFMHFSQTRIATIDVYATFFIILMYYYIYDFYMKKSFETDFKDYLKPLLLCGLFFGIGAASKWIVLYAAPGIAFIFILKKYEEYKEYKSTLDEKTVKKNEYQRLLHSQGGKKKDTGNTKGLLNKITEEIDVLKERYKKLYLIQTFLFCFGFFIIIPSTIYILSYTPFFFIEGQNLGIRHILENQTGMYRYHSELVASHGFSSKWYEWPLIIKPIWFYSGKYVAAGMRSTISSFGNPAIWWVGIITFFSSAIIAFIRKDKKILIIYTAIIFQYIPWILVPRIAFIYHYFSIVPFMIFTTVYTIKYLYNEYKDSKYLIYGYLLLVLILFIVFYPALSGLEVKADYIEGLKWFKGWFF